MIPIANTTLCCVDCLNHQAAIRALRLSQLECQFEKVLFITDTEFQLYDIDVILIPSINSSEQYSHFVLKQLVEYIDTNYIILIQWDGYIINGAAWDNDFFKYDYIGARWPDAKSLEQVGNGGFSLRSRKLLEALQDERAVSKGPEDEDICKHFRYWLIRDYNIQFSPSEVADYFSYERAQPLHQTLGFHGVFNMHQHIGNNEWQYFLDNLSVKTFQSIEILELALNFWKCGKVDITKGIFKKITLNFPDRIDIQFLYEKLEETEVRLTVKNVPLINADEILKFALIKHNDGELQNAWQLYSLAILVEPDNAEVKNLMGIFVAQLDQLELAIKYFKNAIALKNDTAIYYINLAKVYVAYGKADCAITCLQQATARIPNDENLFRNLGQLYENMNRDAEAKSCYEIAQEL